MLRGGRGVIRFTALVCAILWRVVQEAVVVALSGISSILVVQALFAVSLSTFAGLDIQGSFALCYGTASGGRFSRGAISIQRIAN